MKKVTLILVLFLGFIPMLNAQWTSPGNGTTYTMSELVNVTDGVVTFDATNYHIHAENRQRLSENLCRECLGDYSRLHDLRKRQPCLRYG